jgi:hypothetical protein
MAKPLTLGDAAALLAWLSWSVAGHVWRVIRWPLLAPLSLLVAVLWVGDVYVGKAPSVAWIVRRLGEYRRRV